MKHTLYTMMLAGGLMLCTAPAAQAVAASAPATKKPTTTPRKAAPTAKAKATEKTKSTSSKTRKSSSLSRRSVLSVLGLGEAKNVTTPRQRERQLRTIQKQLRAKARSEGRTHRARCGQVPR